MAEQPAVYQAVLLRVLRCKDLPGTCTSPATTSGMADVVDVTTGIPQATDSSGGSPYPPTTGMCAKTVATGFSVLLSSAMMGHLSFGQRRTRATVNVKLARRWLITKPFREIPTADAFLAHDELSFSPDSAHVFQDIQKAGDRCPLNQQDVDHNL